MQIDIRSATVADVPQILRFITELAIYEKAEHEVIATPASLERSLFGEGSPARALIIEVERHHAADPGNK